MKGSNPAQGSKLRLPSSSLLLLIAAALALAAADAYAASHSHPQAPSGGISAQTVYPDGHVTTTGPIYTDAAP
ncbi:MAG: hypothetical protein E6J02_01840 [Chloroflexi bacterium]|nr:MAG: hypothetical protein E6J02_01840 [Chloroflexota bacterium]TME15958.1 MAG: hypothetical protein E6I63_08215 [Chloroflexota bacterium]TME18767.1 MAG: hypothetical protein E6I70_06865 [Chloroflexota bacterium]